MHVGLALCEASWEMCHWGIWPAHMLFYSLSWACLHGEMWVCSLNKLCVMQLCFDSDPSHEVLCETPPMVSWQHSKTLAFRTFQIFGLGSSTCPYHCHIFKYACHASTHKCDWLDQNFFLVSFKVSRHKDC